ncbi:hypothetical protein J4402_00635 [Candidatus Pacearchaeota archaeon]|nr:hypothetical protein [Candidatus Pacearchaeota archaeon]
METRKTNRLRKSLVGLLLAGTIGAAYCNPGCSILPYSAPSASSAEGREMDLERSYSDSKTLESKA